MRRAWIVPMAWCAIAACDEKHEVEPVGARPEPTEAAGPARPEPAQPEPAQPGPTQNEPAQPVPAPEQPAGAGIDLDRLRALVNAGSSFAVNERGILFVAVFEEPGEPEEPMPVDADGIARVAQRLCGDAATAASTAAARTLKLYLELPPDEQMITCNGNVCVKGAQGEYDTENTYTFDTSGETPVLVQIIEIETPLVPEEVVARWRTWAEGERARLEGADCTSTDPLPIHRPE